MAQDQEFEASLDSFPQTNKSKTIKNEKVRGEKRGIREELPGKITDDNKDLLKLWNKYEVVYYFANQENKTLKSKRYIIVCLQ